MAQRAVVRLTRSGAVIAAGERQIDALGRAFRERKWIKLPGLICPDLLSELLRGVAQADYYLKKDGAIAVERCMRQNASLNLLQFLTDDPKLCAFIARISGAGPLAGFDGRIYRFDPGARHYDSWHDDIHKRWDRRVAMSVNLSPLPYEGGRLEIREKKSKRMLGRVDNTTPGDAALFILGPDMEHRVLPVTGGGSRIAFAGWFFERAPRSPRPAAGSNRVRSFLQSSGLL